MTPVEVAKWLNTECTNEEFIEVYALLYKASLGRGIPTLYDKEKLIDSMNTETLCKDLYNVLEDIKEEIKKGSD